MAENDETKNENLAENLADGHDEESNLEELPKDLIDEINSVDEEVTQIAKNTGEIIDRSRAKNEGDPSGEMTAEGKKRVTKAQLEKEKYGTLPIEPKRSYVSQWFKKNNPRKHLGIDFATNRVDNVKVFAYRAGKVVKVVPAERAVAGSGYNGYGNVVVISHGNKKFSLYAHLKEFSVSQGQKVSRGQQIGIAGTTGQSTGIHLHFEVRDAAGYPATQRDPDVNIEKEYAKVKKTVKKPKA